MFLKYTEHLSVPDGVLTRLMALGGTELTFSNEAIIVIESLTLFTRKYRFTHWNVGRKTACFIFPK